jgi:hypothetical protein
MQKMGQQKKVTKELLLGGKPAVKKIASFFNAKRNFIYVSLESLNFAEEVMATENDIHLRSQRGGAA